MALPETRSPPLLNLINLLIAQETDETTDLQSNGTKFMSSTQWPISLAQWSLHRSLKSGDISALEFPDFVRTNFDIRGVEYVNTFFKDRSTDDAWLSSLRSRCEAACVESVLIMVDHEGHLGDPDSSARAAAIENHRRWLHAARALGCHAIRVNVLSEGTPEEQHSRCAAGLKELMSHADEFAIDVVIENHGGLSSNGQWLASLVQAVGHPRLGTLPDFGNFILDWDTKEMYDRYQGIDELLPMAKGLSAKSHDFDDDGNEINTDYTRMFELITKHEYTGWIGVEYEGEHKSEVDGIIMTRDLLIKHGCML